MSGKIRRFWAILGGIIAVTPAALPAQAGFDDTNIRVAARVLGFMEKPPAGPVQVGIAYLPDDPRSAADAARLQNLINGGLQVGNVTLQGRLLKIGESDGANVNLFLLAEGTGSAAGKLAEIARKRHVPCITTDLAQVRSGACAIGVSAAPRVEILVNRTAADASQVRFSTAFRMLITEF